MPSFDMKKLQEELKYYEGVILKIYPDPLHGSSHATCGVGHLLVPRDKHYGLPMGTAITEQDMMDYLNRDTATALAMSRRLYMDFDHLPGEVQLIIADMMFNLGYNK